MKRLATRTNTLQIQTPEGVSFSFLLASPITRFVAFVIDFVCISAVSGLVQKILGILSLISPDIAQGIFVLAGFVISIGYGILAEWFWRGQTFGKKLLRLRVMDAQGLRLQFSQVVIRNLLRFLDMLPVLYLVGGLCAALSRKGQRLGDFAANTIVIRNPRLREPDLDQLGFGKFNSLREYPHLEARLRERASPVEAALALSALIRREHFEPEARVKTFAALARHFRELVPFPPEAVEGIADEQYVRNVAEVLFRPKEKLGARLPGAPLPRG